MSSRITLDTTSLIVRDVIAVNPDTSKVIEAGYIPVIGKEGLFTWKNSREFLSTISIPTLSTTFMGALEMIQPGLSSLSTVFSSTFTTRIASTVVGLGSSGYVSSLSLQSTVNGLGTAGYISSSALFACINNLGNLNNFASTLRFTDGVPRNFGNVGYVSTLHPGEYKIYQSTIGTEGSNLSAYPIPQTWPNYTQSAAIDIGGFVPHIVGSSKMRLDINTNINITYGTAAQTSVSTFIINMNGDLVSNPVSINYGNTSNIYLANASFLLKFADLQNTSNLRLCHSSSRMEGGTITTQIPHTGGIHITLDNTD
jgi:hypothetical protein